MIKKKMVHHNTSNIWFNRDNTDFHNVKVVGESPRVHMKALCMYPVKTMKMVICHTRFLMRNDSSRKKKNSILFQRKKSPVIKLKDCFV